MDAGRRSSAWGPVLALQTPSSQPCDRESEPSEVDQSPGGSSSVAPGARSLRIVRHSACSIPNLRRPHAAHKKVLPGCATPIGHGSRRPVRGSGSAWPRTNQRKALHLGVSGHGARGSRGQSGEPSSFTCRAPDPWGHRGSGCRRSRARTGRCPEVFRARSCFRSGRSTRRQARQLPIVALPAFETVACRLFAAWSSTTHWLKKSWPNSPGLFGICRGRLASPAALVAVASSTGMST